jgi:hypothetical protein
VEIPVGQLLSQILNRALANGIKIEFGRFPNIRSQARSISERYSLITLEDHSFRVCHVPFGVIHLLASEVVELSYLCA